jgi:hypothetical protein
MVLAFVGCRLSVVSRPLFYVLGPLSLIRCEVSGVNRVSRCETRRLYLPAACSGKSTGAHEIALARSFRRFIPSRRLLRGRKATDVTLFRVQHLSEFLHSLHCQFGHP